MDNLPADLIRRLAGDLEDIRPFSLVNRTFAASCCELDDWRHWRGERGPKHVMTKMNITRYSVKEYVMVGNLDMVTFSIEYGKNTNCIGSEDKYTLDQILVFASAQGHLEVVKYLINAGANSHFKNECALRVALYAGHLDVVRYIIENDRKLQCSDEDLLRNAVKHLHVIKYLVEVGININTFGYNIMRLAVKYNRLDITKYVIESGAVSNVEEHFIDACCLGHIEIVIFLGKYVLNISDVIVDTTIVGAVRHLEVVKYLIESAGADIHYNDDSFLLHAVRCGSLDVVRYLVEKGANIHAREDKALQVAVVCGLDIVKYLVENGANIHARDNAAIRFAAGDMCFKVVKYLAEKGANIHTPGVLDDIRNYQGSDFADYLEVMYG